MNDEPLGSGFCNGHRRLTIETRLPSVAPEGERYRGVCPDCGEVGEAMPTKSAAAAAMPTETALSIVAWTEDEDD